MSARTVQRAVTGSAHGLLVTGLLTTAALASTLALALSGALSPAQPTILEFSADYPAFDSVEDLEQAADLVVVARFSGDSRTDLVLPQESSSTDPVVNPLAGVDPSVEQPPTQPIVTTLHSATVIRSLSGGLEAGSVIEVRELGGTHDGVTYVSDSSRINSRGTYLMFLAEIEPGRYALLNPDEAKFPMAAGGKPAKLTTNESLVTTEDLRAYVD